MPQDKLTESFRDMLGESGITASDTDIGSFLGEKLDIFDEDNSDIEIYDKLIKQNENI